ncbi:MAG TPA: methyltransferase [Ilumatobacteraceae bacterium]|nr:methyltransferase [Ilumatobacteraceae bacterium]
MPPPNHYFEESPQSRSDERTIDVALPDVSFSMRTDHGVFSHGRLDTGTAILLREAPPPPPTGTFVDLGCGAGAIALTLAMRAPLAAVLAVDVNARARTLCSDNAARLGLTNISVVHPDEVPVDLAVDLIWSNPPIRVGKPALHAILTTWLGRLAPNGSAVLVVQRHLGADSLDRWLRSTGCTTRRLAARGGYRLLECKVSASSGDAQADEHRT